MPDHLDSFSKTSEGRNQHLSWKIGWIFILIGLGVSTYLSYAELGQKSVQCIDSTIFDCTAVQSSAWSKVFGIPVALIGLCGYIMFALLWYGETRIRLIQTTGRFILFAFALGAWFYSMWLVYVQLRIIQAFCQWCLIHEMNISALFLLISYRLWEEASQS